MSTLLADPNYVGDLGSGLVRRWSTPADQERIGRCLATVFRNSPEAPLQMIAFDETRIMMSPGYPFMEPGDFAIVEDTSVPECPVVACTCCWSHVWSYGGISFGMGQPETVATLPDYRNKGLVRAIFEMFHARSAAKGELVQGITGIPYFYRQFGYEYVLDLDGRRSTYVAVIPEMEGDEPEPYCLRLATYDDVPDLLALYNLDRSTSLVWHETTESYWRYHITSWEDPALHGKSATEIGLIGRMHMIVDTDGKVCGYAWLATKRRSPAQRVFALQLYPHVNWQAAMPSLLRAFRVHGQQIPAMTPETKPFSEIWFDLGRAHPAYTVLGEKLAPRGEPPYAWYLRVPDVPGFIRHIAPVLEQRLAHSILANHSGDLIVDFYRGGLRLHFDQGKLVTAEPWRAPAYGNEPPAGCPPLTFLQLLFGYRSLAELRATFPDVWAEQEAALLLDILFPKQPSTVLPLSYG
jgi:hypothetical protein